MIDDVMCRVFWRVGHWASAFLFGVTGMTLPEDHDAANDYRDYKARIREKWGVYRPGGNP